MQIRDDRTPVTILTGFLGAGKTTLMNRILTEKHGMKMAVIVNGFGEVGIDNQLVLDSEEEIFEMNNGCICCNVRGDLIRILKNLIEAKKTGKIQFDRVLIETTGLADPGPVVQTFLVDALIEDEFKVDAVITVVDAYHAEKQLSKGHEAQEQVAFADVLLINKIELVEQEKLDELIGRLKSMNPSAKTILTSNCQTPIDQILGINSFDLDEKLKISPDLLSEHHHHNHDDHVKSFAIDETKPLDFEKLNQLMTKLVEQQGENLYRYKGILFFEGVEERVVFQGVHMLFAAVKERRWRDSEERKSQMVFIGKDLNREWFEEQFRQCIAG